MNDERTKFIMDDLNKKMKWLQENTNHDIIYLALQGSQNYEMDIYSDEYTSDIDVKAICLPSFDDILRGRKMVSHTYVMDDNSHIDVKDIRLYCDLWKKSNPQFLEILFTKFYIVKNERFKDILEMADDIASANVDRLLSCIKGMQMEKYKALKHPYPTIKDKIDKYGYDPKQFHHIERLCWVAFDICKNNKTFREALIPMPITKEYLLCCKCGMYSLYEVEEQSKTSINRLKDVVETYRENNELKVNEEVYEKVNEIIYDIVKSKCIKEVKEDE